MEPSTRITTWGDSSAIPNAAAGSSNQADEALAHDGPVLGADDALDPAGAVTARTVEAGPSNVGEGTPEGSVSGTRSTSLQRDDSVRTS